MPPPSDTEPGFWRRHPVDTAIMVGCTVGGAALTPVLADGFTLLQALFAGALAGVGVGLFIVTPRLIA